MISTQYCRSWCLSPLYVVFVYICCHFYAILHKKYILSVSGESCKIRHVLMPRITLEGVQVPKATWRCAAQSQELRKEAPEGNWDDWRTREEKPNQLLSRVGGIDTSTTEVSIPIYSISDQTHGYRYPSCGGIDTKVLHRIPTYGIDTHVVEVLTPRAFGQI